MRLKRLAMTKHYNKKEKEEKRRQLRKNQTYCENLVWYYIRNRQLLGIKFKRQYSIDKYVIDFYAPEIKFAIELDGDVHNEQKEYDAERQEYLEGFGIKFLRIKNEELLGNPNKVFKKIEDEIKSLKLINR